jgi:tetratricopeptide (TPR) repeat protein
MNLKKTIILLLFVSFLLPGYILSQGGNEEKFRQGADYYSAGDYENALVQWKDIYNTGYRSAELIYNIGNACFKLNKTPEAILFYERAILLKQADEDISYNLQIARTLVVDRFEEIPELFFVKWFDFISLLTSTNSWASISIVTFVLCLIFLSIYFYTSRYKMKVLSFWLAVSLIVISLFALSFSIRNKSLVTESREGIIFSPLVNGKSSPDDSGTDLFILHEGTKVSIEDEVGEWIEIRLSDGNKGWVPGNSLEII